MSTGTTFDGLDRSERAMILHAIATIYLYLTTVDPVVRLQCGCRAQEAASALGLLTDLFDSTIEPADDDTDPGI